MIAFYAMGGGWGHLTRIKTFIQNQGIHAPFKVITANREVATFFDEQSVLYISADEQSTTEELASNLEKALEPFQFTACYVDVFPNGILGELSMELFPGAAFYYLGRRLRWDHYQPLVRSSVEFNTAFLFEELEAPHQAFIERHSRQVARIQLDYPAPDLSFSHALLDSDQPIWLIVHTSRQEEVTLLLDHARDIASIENAHPCFVVLSDTRTERPGVHWLSGQNPLNWYPNVDRIFTAAGFNSWHQLAPWRSKHTCLPFPRKFDDQHWRSQQKNAGY